MKPGRRISGMAVENSVMQMHSRAKAAIKTLITTACQPDQIRVLDSRSYLRMTSSTSAAMFCASSLAVAGVFLSGVWDKVHLSFFSSDLRDNYGRGPLP